MSAYGERIARVEVEVQSLKASFEEHKASTEKTFYEINGKLDDLLRLRNKGAGVVWLASGLMGTGVIGGLIELFHMFWSK